MIPVNKAVIEIQMYKCFFKFNCRWHYLGSLNVFFSIYRCNETLRHGMPYFFDILSNCFQNIFAEMNIELLLRQAKNISFYGRKIFFCNELIEFYHSKRLDHKDIQINEVIPIQTFLISRFENILYQNLTMTKSWNNARSLADL